MTRATFITRDGRICGFVISGHTAECDCELGRIVCSAVSSAAYMVANTVTEIIGAEADACDSDGHMALTVQQPNKLTDAVLCGLQLHLSELSKQYPQHIKVNSEVQPNA